MWFIHPKQVGSQKAVAVQMVRQAAAAPVTQALVEQARPAPAGPATQAPAPTPAAPR